MRKPPPYHEAGEPLEPSGLEDLLTSCATVARLEILLLLFTGPMAVGEIASILQYALPHVSNHLRVLRGAGLVVCDHCKKQRVYALTVKTAVRQEGNAIVCLLTGDDGSELRVKLPAAADFYRELAPKLRDLLDSRLSPVVEVRVPKDGASAQSRPTTGLESPGASRRDPPSTP